MDNIKILFEEDNTTKNLVDISEDKFDKYMWESGCNDLEYQKYMRENNFIDLMDINPQTTPKIVLLVECPWSQRILKFNCIYDSDNDNTFIADDYFKNKE